MPLRVKIIFSIITILLLILIVKRYMILDDLLLEGSELYRIQEETQKVKGENKEIRREVLQRSSLQSIERQARDTGFIDATYYILK